MLVLLQSQLLVTAGLKCIHGIKLWTDTNVFFSVSMKLNNAAGDYTGDTFTVLQLKSEVLVHNICYG